MTRALNFLLLSLVGPAWSHAVHNHHKVQRRDVTPPNFGYHGLQGPANWYSLNPTANALCATGENQSPVNFEGACGAALPSNTLSIQTASTGAHFVNLGSTVEVEGVTGTLNYNSKQYSLLQFHFHTPSEHTIHDEHYPMEVHFVWRASDGARAVTGFHIEISTQHLLGIPIGTNDLLERVLTRTHEIPDLGDEVSLTNLVFTSIENHFKNNGVYQYSGSLTTPPCDEGISWIVSCAPLYIAPATYRQAKDVIKFNSRFTQNKNAINVIENVSNELGCTP